MNIGSGEWSLLGEGMRVLLYSKRKKSGAAFALINARHIKACLPNNRKELVYFWGGTYNI